jgi:hypothetical protein
MMAVVLGSGRSNIGVVIVFRRRLNFCREKNLNDSLPVTQGMIEP